MKRKQFSEEQIIGNLMDAEAGEDVERRLDLDEPGLNRQLSETGGNKICWLSSLSGPRALDMPMDPNLQSSSVCASPARPSRTA